MNTNFDVIIVGSGPAGVSAAFPLLEKGFNVLMLDGGKTPSKPMLSENFLTARKADTEQWRWMIGEDFHALKMQNAISPKLRIPHLSYVFDQFLNKNNITSDNFIGIGSLASGGLSNAWGAGVAQFSQTELASFPVPISEWPKHYESVAKRMGISGNQTDDLSTYFNLDSVAQSPVPLDEIHADFLSSYNKHQKYFSKNAFTLGRSRVAVLTQNSGERKACSLSGNCLWGCSNRSIYSASEDIIALKKHSNFQLISGVIVENISRNEDTWLLDTKDTLSQNSLQFAAPKVLLAAGTIATTRLALKTLALQKEIKLLSSPTAAFLVWNYKRFGASRKSGFGLGQLSYKIDAGKGITAFGSTFATSGIPISEFAKQVPLSRYVAIDVLSALLSSCVVGNIFLPGHLTHATAQLMPDNTLKLKGNYGDQVAPAMQEVSKQVRGAFFKMGGLVLPGSFTIGQPGSDIHYAGSLPMVENPQLGQTSADGELAGTQGLYIIDGASLPILPEKSHTLTIMANAERIASRIAQKNQPIRPI